MSLIKRNFPQKKLFGAKHTWEWGQSTWLPFFKEQKKDLENSFLEGKKFVKLHYSTSAINQSGYSVYFKSMQQVNDQTNFARDVRRILRPRNLSYLFWLLILAVSARVVEQVVQDVKHEKLNLANADIKSLVESQPIIQELLQRHTNTINHT